MGAGVKLLGLVVAGLLVTAGGASASDYLQPVGAASPDPATPGPTASISAKAPYTLGGKPWPGHTIKVVDKSKGFSNKVFDAAFRAWNKSGANIRFKEVKHSNGRHIEITTDRKMNGGEASLGYMRPGSALVHWYLGDCNVPSSLAKRICPGSKVARVPRGGGHIWFQKVTKAEGKENFPEWVRVAAHELGHTLGLAHNNTDCLTMNTYPRVGCSYSNSNAAKLTCVSPRRGDVQGVVRRYGGRNRVKRTPNLCDKFRKPGPPSLKLSGSSDDGYTLNFDITSGRMPPPYVKSFGGGSIELLTSGLGKCPFRKGGNGKSAAAKYKSLGTFDLPLKAKTGDRYKRQADHPDSFDPSGHEYCAAAYFEDRLGRYSGLSAPVDLPPLSPEFFDDFE